MNKIRKAFYMLKDNNIEELIAGLLIVFSALLWLICLFTGQYIFAAAAFCNIFAVGLIYLLYIIYTEKNDN